MGCDVGAPAAGLALSKLPHSSSSALAVPRGESCGAARGVKAVGRGCERPAEGRGEAGAGDRGAAKSPKSTVSFAAAAAAAAAEEEIRWTPMEGGGGAGAERPLDMIVEEKSPLPNPEDDDNTGGVIATAGVECTATGAGAEAKSPKSALLESTAGIAEEEELAVKLLANVEGKEEGTEGDEERGAEATEGARAGAMVGAEGVRAAAAAG